MMTPISELLSKEELDQLEGLREWMTLDRLPTIQDILEWQQGMDWAGW